MSSQIFLEIKISCLPGAGADFFGNPSKKPRFVLHKKLQRNVLN